MPKSFKYTSMKRIFSKIERDFGLTSFNEYDIVEWAGEALEQIGTINQYQERLSFIEVRNHQCEIPCGFEGIIQIAKNNCHKNEEEGLCPREIKKCIESKPQGLSPVMVNSCGIPVSDITSCPVIIDCKGEPITDYEVAYYRPFFDLNAEYFGWTESDLYNSCFTPVRSTTNTMFNSIILQQKEDNHIPYRTEHRHGHEEYKIIDNEILRFSFKHGQIVIAYLGLYLDPETNYPMIPDLVSVTTALGYYIQWKLSSRKFYNNREGSEKQMLESEKQWIWYCRQAGNELIQPHGIDDYQDILDQMTYLVPQKSRYFGFFGKLNKPEDTLQYDNPNRRMLNLFRGGAFLG